MHKNELKELCDEILSYAKEVGLDPFETIFEIVDYEKMNEIASYEGFPRRYPHWSYGMEYEFLKKSYRYGLHKIYELVINNDPCYAYLLESNSLVDQKLVIAHVYAHSDFFKNNIWFSQTDRKMIDSAADHAAIIRKYEDRYGMLEVENFLDICLSIEDLIDYHSLFIKQRKEVSNNDAKPSSEIAKLKSKSYMEPYLSPLKEFEAQKKKKEMEKKNIEPFPEKPVKDILLFFIENAPLENWQKVILSIIREESYYFAPQKLTKIMNEGWACYWHSYLMTHKILKDSELIDYADHHSGTLSSPTGTVNPYKLGFELWKDIEDRWNKGKFGKEYELCDDLEAKLKWNKNLNLGKNKIFEVRKAANDITFIDNYFTEELAQKLNLFTYSYNKETGWFEIANRNFKDIKAKLLNSVTNFGKPIILLTDANYKNRGELYLKHQHEGIDLDILYAKETLKNIYFLWKRPVHIETIVSNKMKLLTYDGQGFTETPL